MSESLDARATPYAAPIDDVMVALEVAGIKELLDYDDFAHVEIDHVRPLLEEFGRLCAQSIAPTDRIGDLVGAQLDPSSHQVATPNAFHEAYARYVEGGWGALQFPTQYGGGGLPGVVALALQEMFASANLSLSLNPVLTQGAIEALLRWGDAVQQSTFLPRLLTGEWTGTMNLTEPDAGSDLGEITTTAERDDEGVWRVTGTKIFITWGEHDLTENIVHLVLARTPDAPAGTRGLSLFVVPKFLVNPDGSLGERNSLRAQSLEHKLGIHGSPTCVMSFEGARAELVGPFQGGMRAMFTMMNAARISIGAQGPAVAERAFQHALAYAQDRRQGRSKLTGERQAIIEHADVRRMLLTMTTTTQAARLLLLWTSAQGDRARHAPDHDVRLHAQEMIDLLTPVAKAWSTDVGFAAASLGVQVLGGAGFIEESGMAQRLRDGRIAPIYEGTNGIQAIDLVTRKISREQGKWVHQLLDEISSVASTTTDAELTDSARALASAVDALRTSTQWMLEQLEHHPDDAIAGASAYLELFGVTMGGWLLTRRALGSTSAQRERFVGECNFFALDQLTKAPGLAQVATAGARHLTVPIGDRA